MAISETFAKPLRRSNQNISEDGDDDDDDENPIATINAMSIRVSDDDDNSSTPASKATNIEIQKTTATANNKSSSLRSLLGVPPTSNSSQRTLQGSVNNATSNNLGGMLGVPPSTSARTAPTGIGGASGAVVGGGGGKDVKTLPSEIAPKRRKVILGPGCSALDWARLKSSIPSQGFRKIKPSELKLHKSKESVWSAFNGKVYDLTPYLRFHPGGVDELMRVAGRDGTRLFSE